jgi:hypothetical protein
MLKVNRRFGETFLLHLQYRRIRQTSNQSELNRNQSLKMEVTCYSETSVDLQRTTQRYIPEDRTQCNRRCENLKSYRYRTDGAGVSLSLSLPQYPLNLSRSASEQYRIKRREVTGIPRRHTVKLCSSSPEEGRTLSFSFNSTYIMSQYNMKLTFIRVT